jgi:hypothetical protein
MQDSLGKGALCMVVGVLAIAMLAFPETDELTFATSIWKVGLAVTFAALLGMLLGQIGHLLETSSIPVRLLAIAFPLALVVPFAVQIGDFDAVRPTKAAVFAAVVIERWTAPRIALPRMLVRERAQIWRALRRFIEPAVHEGRDPTGMTVELIAWVALAAMVYLLLAGCFYALEAHCV